jgi:hypothetical protein
MNSEPIFLHRLDKNANKLRACSFQDKNADMLRSLQEPSGRRLAGFVRPRACLPRTTKNKPAHCCAPSLMAKNSFSGPQSATCGGVWPVTLKTPRTIPCCKRASAKPTGVQSGCRQRPRQLVDVGLDSSNKAEAACLVKASSKPPSLAVLVGTAVLPRRSQIFWGERVGNGTARNNSRKQNFVVLASTYAFGKMSLTDASEQQVQKDCFAIRLKCDCTRYHS